MAVCGIYKIYCSSNDKTYYGSTGDWQKRRYNHINKLRKGTHENQRIQNAFNRYGENSFRFLLVSYVIKAHLLRVEQMYLDTQPCEFNIARDAIRPWTGRKHSKKSRMKMRRWQVGKKLSEETKRKIGDGNKGKIKSVETRLRLSRAIRKNKVNHGEKNGSAKLSRDNICEIRDMYSSGVPRKIISGKFNVNIETIRKIALKIFWKEAA